MARRRPFHQVTKVPLSDEEREQALLLRHLAIRQSVREEAQLLLDGGADPDDLKDLRIGCTTSLHGHRVACERFGVASLAACEMAQRRVRQRGLVDSALYLAVLYEVGRTAPPPIYLSGGSGLGGGGGLAFPCGAGIDPSIPVRRFPPAVQSELWDGDDVPWTELSRLREEYEAR